MSKSDEKSEDSQSLSDVATDCDSARQSPSLHSSCKSKYTFHCFLITSLYYRVKQRNFKNVAVALPILDDRAVPSFCDKVVNCEPI